jgi:hypothetical protein
MNVVAWKAAPEAAGLATKYADVVNGFVHGFDQGIPRHSILDLQWFTPPNHLLADQSREEIETNLKKELAVGRMFGPFLRKEVAKKFPFFRSSPLGTAVNSDGSVCPINNLSFPHGQPDYPSVNLCVDKDNFTTTWDDFKTVARFFRKHPKPFQLGLFDWEKAYRQIPMKENQWLYLLVRNFENQLLLDTRITFGGSFGRPADAWKELILHKFDLIHIFRWVDDNMLVKLPTVKTTMQQIVDRSQLLGVKTNTKKYSEFPNK